MGWPRGSGYRVKWSLRNFVCVFSAALAAPLSLWTVAFLLYASNARGLRGDSGGAGSRWAAAGRRRGRDDGLAPSFFTRYPPHDCLEGRGVVSGAYAANVSGFRMRGADHAGPREKLSATRSLSAPSVRQRLSAAEPLAFWRGRNARESRLAHSNNAVCWLCVSYGLA